MHFRVRRWKHFRSMSSDVTNSVPYQRHESSSSVGRTLRFSPCWFYLPLLPVYHSNAKHQHLINQVCVAWLIRSIRWKLFLCDVLKSAHNSDDIWMKAELENRNLLEEVLDFKLRLVETFHHLVLLQPSFTWAEDKTKLQIFIQTLETSDMWEQRVNRQHVACFTHCSACVSN